MPEKQEIQIRNNYDLAKPVEMVSMAKVLKHHIVGQKLYTNIVGKNYAHVEGWQFAGGLMGTYPRVIAVWVMKLAGYEATPSKQMAKMGEIHQAPPKEPAPEGPILCAGATKGGCPDGATINDIEAQYSRKVFGSSYVGTARNQPLKRNNAVTSS